MQAAGDGRPEGVADGGGHVPQQGGRQPAAAGGHPVRGLGAEPPGQARLHAARVDGAQERDAQRAADGAHQGDRSARGAHVADVGAVHRDEHGALHQQAHAKPGDQGEGGRDGRTGAHVEQEQDEGAHRHHGAAEDRVDAVAAVAADELADRQLRTEHAEHQRQQQQAAGGRGGALDELHVLRQEVHRAEHDGADEEAQDLGEGEVAVAEQPRRDDRFGGAPFDVYETGQCQDAGGAQAEDLRRGPGVRCCRPSRPAASGSGCRRSAAARRR